MLNQKIDYFMKEKVEKAFESVKGNSPETVKVFLIQWGFTDLIHNFFDKIERYSNFLFSNKPPSDRVFPIFSKVIFDNAEIQKDVFSFIEEELKKDPKEPSKSVINLFKAFAELGKKISDFDGDFKTLIEPTYVRIYKSIHSSRVSYANHYPEDDTEHTANADFYSGQSSAQTGGGMIGEVHKNFFGDYSMLEERHNYIQFLFPIREAGMAGVQPLTKNEADLFQRTPQMQENLIKSYEIMLDFYGLQLKDKKTGQVERSNNWEERYRNLSWHSHNYLRITRILKCLGICGLEYMKKPLIEHFITEVFKNKQLEETKFSLVKFWLPTLRNESQLVEMENLIEKYSRKKVCRKVYDREERTWANVCYPLDPAKDYGGADKTFYNRDDGEDTLDEKYLQVERQWGLSGGSGGECSMM